jgi:hypothetical protein
MIIDLRERPWEEGQGQIPVTSSWDKRYNENQLNYYILFCLVSSPLLAPGVPFMMTAESFRNFAAQT